LSSEAFSHQDLCYPHWRQLSKDNHGQALVYLQDSKTLSSDVLLAVKQSSEGLKAIPKNCRDAAAALLCSGTLLACEYAPMEQGIQVFGLQKLSLIR